MAQPSNSMSTPFSWKAVLLCAVSACSPLQRGSELWSAGGWQRHTIDDSSLGADGVRLGDINKDGRMDIVSPWEQGGRVRLYLNPGSARVQDRWPAVTVGEVGDPEDAFFVDLDGDGWLDVVSSCEGETRSIFIHWAPPDRASLLAPDAWETEELPAASGLARWMYGFAMQVDGRAGLELVVGAKGESAHVGWFEAPRNPRDLEKWTWHPLHEAGWIMTLRSHDFDSDGDLDILATDRTGAGRGTLWLENPGPNQAASAHWLPHRLGPRDDHEAMHNAVADLDGDGLEDVLVASRGDSVRYYRRAGPAETDWETQLIEMPPQTGHGKAVAAGDIDLDGIPDLVVACARADGGKIGVFWMAHHGTPMQPRWSATPVSGPEGFIYDLIQLTDVDDDGDLDVVTVEEKGPYLARGYEGRELGVIWYENPAISDDSH